MSSDLVRLTAILHDETDDAILVSPDGDIAHAVWILRTMFDVESSQETDGAKRMVILIPEWSALGSGLA